MLAMERVRLYRSLRRITALAGWILYGYEWVNVSYVTPSAEAIQFVFLLVLSTLLIHTGISGWIGHNKRIASRGTRGLVTRYISPVFVEDNLGRELVRSESSYLSQEIVVGVRGNAKYYAAADEAMGWLNP